MHTLSVVQTYYMRAIHGRIVPLYAPPTQTQTPNTQHQPPQPPSATSHSPDAAGAAPHPPLFETCASVSELGRQFRDLVGSVGSVVGLARDEALQLFRIGFAAATVVRNALCMMRWLEGDPSADDCAAGTHAHAHVHLRPLRCDQQGVEAQLEAAAQLFDEFRAAVRQFAAALHAIGNVRY